jgi:hypothetical protein
VQFEALAIDCCKAIVQYCDPAGWRSAKQKIQLPNFHHRGSFATMSRCEAAFHSHIAPKILILPGRAPAEPEMENLPTKLIAAPLEGEPLEPSGEGAIMGSR